MLKTESYVKGTIGEVKVGNEYYFGELWDGNGEGIELLKNGSISMVDEDPVIDEDPMIDEEEWEYCTVNTVEFEVLDEDENIMDVLVKVTSIRNEYTETIKTEKVDVSITPEDGETLDTVNPEHER